VFTACNVKEFGLLFTVLSINFAYFYICLHLCYFLPFSVECSDRNAELQRQIRFNKVYDDDDDDDDDEQALSE